MKAPDTPSLSPRPWSSTDRFMQEVAREFHGLDCDARHRALLREVARNRRIHEQDCVNLNPATNVMNPAAETLLAAGLGSRPSLGAPGEKYEMGLEAIERIEIFAAELACELFSARHAEIRVASGAMANLYGFMACCRPGDTVIVPPVAIGGHVTHHAPGAAGLFGLDIVEAPVDTSNFSVDVDALAKLANKVAPRLITIGGSLNLGHHPVREIRAIADSCGARVLFDAAHLSGIIAGGRWPNPLDEGADLVTMSTYKSLGGPPSGLLLSNDDDIARRIESIAFPGLTANFDVSKSAALAVTLLDWLEHGGDYASKMIETCDVLGRSLLENELPVFAGRSLAGKSHQLAIEAHRFGGGQAMARKLRSANLLSSGIGLPTTPCEGDMNGLRLGTPECVRWGMDVGEMECIGAWVADVLLDRRHIDEVAGEVSDLKGRFTTVHYIRQPDTRTTAIETA